MVAGDVPGLPGVKIPYPSSVNMEAQADSEQMPEVNMTPNDGDQRDVASPPFAVGKDERHLPKTGGANDTPGMPGA
jgi:hypothetical protein